MWHGIVFGFLIVWIWLNWKVGREVTLTLHAMLCKKCQKWKQLVIIIVWGNRNSLFIVFFFWWSFIICRLWASMCCFSCFDDIWHWLMFLCSLFWWCATLCYTMLKWCVLWNFKQSYIGGGAMNARVQKGELKFLLMFIILKVGQWV